MNWRNWLMEGDQYQNAMGGRVNKSSGFDIVFQSSVSALAMESFVMAILDYHKKLLFKTTFSDFVKTLQTVVQLDPNLRDRILQHDQIQRVCSFTVYTKKEAISDQVDDFSEAVKEISVLAHKICIQKC